MHTCREVCTGRGRDTSCEVSSKLDQDTSVCWVVCVEAWREVMWGCEMGSKQEGITETAVAVLPSVHGDGAALQQKAPQQCTSSVDCREGCIAAAYHCCCTCYCYCCWPGCMVQQQCSASICMTQTPPTAAPTTAPATAATAATVAAAAVLRGNATVCWM
jgi:hypothetical protein